MESNADKENAFRLQETSSLYANRVKTKGYIQDHRTP